mgnify:CR=1 FL=1
MLFVCRKRIVLIHCAILEPAATMVSRCVHPCKRTETAKAVWVISSSTLAGAIPHRAAPASFTRSRYVFTSTSIEDVEH